MGVRIDQLIKLQELKDLKLVGGSDGVSKVVHWVHSLETPDLIKYVQDDELIMLTGIGVYNNNLSFNEMIKGLIEKRAAGLIVNVGKYIMQVPEDMKKLADENNFSIFEVPWKVSLAEISRIICGEIIERHLEETLCQDLLKNVIFFNKITSEDFKERISKYGYKYFNSFRIIIVTIDKFQQYLWSKNIKEEQSVAHFKDRFLEMVNSAIWDSRFKPISFLQNDSVVFLIINEKDKFSVITMLTKFINESSKKRFSDMEISIGIGNAHEDFSKIKKSYAEAERALKAIKAEEDLDKTKFYSNIGIYKLLTEIDNINLLKEYYYETVGKLEQYDKQNNTNFVKILYIFLQENGNYVQTAQRLYMHRNTLIYKINKIQELIKKDLTDAKIRLEFYTAYLIKQINDF